SLKGGAVEVYRAVHPGENVALAGSDLTVGEHSLRGGILLTSREIGVLAALGIAEAPCYVKPKVYVASTGGELTEPGSPLAYGKIYDINSYSLMAAVSETGCQPVSLGVIPDDAEKLKGKILEGVEKGDVLLVSGGTSAGAGDLLYRVAESLGEILFHGVSIKPGKPTLAAKVEGKPVLGLPGYPTSALMVFHKLFSPILRAMAGLPPEAVEGLVEARTGEKMFSAQGRREFIPVHLVEAEGGLLAFQVEGGSGAITSLADADGFLEVPENRTILEAGEPVKVRLFSVKLSAPHMVVAGSPCPGLEVLLKLLKGKHPWINFKMVASSSTGGLAALKRGLADLAGIHLYDLEEKQYNLPFIKRYGLEGKAALYRGYLRRVGFILPKGNPKGFSGIKDLLKPGVTFVNLSRNFEARTLLDIHLEKLASEKGLKPEELALKIGGYSWEARSPQAVVSIILHGKADVGLGVEAAAELHGLDFIPLAVENYDFAVRLDRAEKPAVKAFLETLSSEEFKESLKKVHGLQPTPQTGERIC
ncbi:MAG: molybdopterin biosynthesis protein, partial [Candidatus Hecatellales archaeon]